MHGLKYCSYCIRWILWCLEGSLAVSSYTWIECLDVDRQQWNRNVVMYLVKQMTTTTCIAYIPKWPPFIAVVKCTRVQNHLKSLLVSQSYSSHRVSCMKHGMVQSERYFFTKCTWAHGAPWCSSSPPTSDSWTTATSDCCRSPPAVSELDTALILVFSYREFTQLVSPLRIRLRGVRVLRVHS